MGTISTNEELQNAIRFFEEEQTVKLKLMKDSFNSAYESLRPVNLIESTLEDIASSPYLIDNIWSTALGLTSGYLSKKVVVGMSENKLSKFLGAILQFGITNIIAKNPTAIKNMGSYIIQYLFPTKKSKS